MVMIETTNLSFHFSNFEEKPPAECEILNRDWYRHPRAGMKFKIIEDYVPKPYRKARRKTK